MKFREYEYLQSLTGNNRTVQQNVENGLKAWFTRQQRLVEKAIHRGVNVSGLLTEYLHALEIYDNDYSVNGIISKELGYIKPEGFYRFGDRNCETAAIRRNYFRPSGRHIDELADELTNRYNREISPSDIAEFITDYPEREYEPLQAIKEIEDLFKKSVGFNLGRKFAGEYLTRHEPVKQNCPF